MELKDAGVSTEENRIAVRVESRRVKRSLDTIPLWPVLNVRLA